MPGSVSPGRAIGHVWPQSLQRAYNAYFSRATMPVLVLLHREQCGTMSRLACRRFVWTVARTLRESGIWGCLELDEAVISVTFRRVRQEAYIAGWNDR